jgi:acyl-CoA thioesterase FadM
VSEPDLHPGVDTSTWWHTVIEPWWRDFDELGHMTAAAYPAAFEEAFGRYLIERWRRTDPSYVVARTVIDYHHEVTRRELPVTIHVQPVRVGRSSASVHLVLEDASGRVCTLAQTRYVAWDMEKRCARPFTHEERVSLEGPEPG